MLEGEVFWPDCLCFLVRCKMSFRTLGIEFRVSCLACVAEGFECTFSVYAV